MTIYTRITVLLLSAMLLAFGCVSSSPKKERPPEPGLVEQYIAKGEGLESEGRFSSALEQYELALTVAPDHPAANQHKQQVLSILRTRAEEHYNKGLALDEQGKYEAARKEYLSALQNWPDYQEAKEKLTPGGVVNDTAEYIIHSLAHGESVSKLALIYYGDLRKYPVIGKFNNLQDVTRVRVGQKLKIPVEQGMSLAQLQQTQKAYHDSRKAEEKSGSSAPIPEEKEQAPPEEESQETVPATDADSVAAIPPDPGDAPSPEQDMETREIEEKVAPEPEIVEEEPVEEKAVQKVVDGEEDKTAMETTVPVSYDSAIALFDKKEYAKAIPLFEAAEKSAPEDETLRNYLFESHFQLGLTQFKANRFLPAKRSFEAALGYDVFCDMCPEYIEKSEETYKEKHYNLGIHYFGKEQLKKAIDEWKRVKALDPNYKEVSANLKKAQLLYERLESIKKGKAQ